MANRPAEAHTGFSMTGEYGHITVLIDEGGDLKIHNEETDDYIFIAAKELWKFKRGVAAISVL